jgi:selenocysteine-specific elongation factor
MIVGTAGHVDHGKTALVRALTGVDTDRLKEEKARGISIDLGFAYLPAPDGEVIGFVDVPGHERFIHNMLAGAACIDFALLVVAVDDGVMPQTVEHLAILDLLGIRRGLIVLSKVDLVSFAERAQRRAEITDLLASTSLAAAAILEVSPLNGEGIDAVRSHLFSAAAETRRRPANGRFRLAVDRSFTLAGAGTIVTGTVLSGAVEIGDRLAISPSGMAARVRSIHAQSRPAERGLVGERCALNLSGDRISKEAITRGDTVLDPHLHAPTDRLDARLRVLRSEARPVPQWLPTRFHHGAAECGARIVLLEDEPITPGDEGWVQLVLDHPIAACVGDRFILRDTSARRTIGGGVLVDLHAPARKRRTPERRRRLEAMALADPCRSLEGLFAASPDTVDLSAFARDRAMSDAEIETAAKAVQLVALATPNATFALSEPGWEAFSRALHTMLAEFHAENPDLQGVPRERLRRSLQPLLAPPVFLVAAQMLAESGEIVLDGAWVRLKGHRARLAPENETLWYRVRPKLGGQSRFRPPRVRDLAETLSAPEAQLRRTLKLAGRLGWVDEIATDHFFLREAVAEIVAFAQDIARHAPDGQFTAAQLRDRLDNGRKVAIQILEFFDRHGVTLRRGDLRRINPLRVDLLIPPTASDVSSVHEGRDAPPVRRPDFKLEADGKRVLGGFDPRSRPPARRRAR